MLLEAGVNLARERGLPALTTQPDDDARGFYARHGFGLWRLQHELQLETTASQPLLALTPVTSPAQLPEPGMALRIGRYQSGPQGWEVLWPSLELPGWSDLRRFVWRGDLESGPAVLGLCQQLTDPTQADAYVWGATGASLVPALRALHALAGAQGFQAVDVLLATEDLPEAHQHFRLGFQTQVELWRRQL